MESAMKTGSFLAFLFCLFEFTNGAKILMLPIFHTSHVNFFVTADVLRMDGHDITIVSHPRNKKVMKNPHMHYLFTENKENLMDTSEFQKGMFNNEMAKISSAALTAIPEYCESILGYIKLMQTLENEKFDLAIVEGESFMMCLYIIPYKLGIPYISIQAGPIDPWTVRVPTLPSVEPLPLHIQSNNMNFWGRLKNLFTFTSMQIATPWIMYFYEDHLVEKYVSEKPQISIQELHKQAQLWLVNWEPYILDYPRASTPYYHFIGGIGATPAKPLPADMEAFIQENKKGCIILTFGSALKSIPVPIMKNLFEVFRQIPLNVLIKNDGETPKDVPKNVKVFKWLPQNDILGHPMTKLFITHGGNNGQQEALYHGIPQLVMPVAGDQPYNALRVKTKGFGLEANIRDFTVEELVSKIKEVSLTDKYRIKAKKASTIFRNLPDPKKTFTFWVDHVLQYGGDHLRPSYIDMPFYQFFMLDLLAFIVLILLIVFYLISRFCRCCCGLCRKRVNKEKKA